MSVRQCTSWKPFKRSVCLALAFTILLQLRTAPAASTESSSCVSNFTADFMAAAKTMAGADLEAETEQLMEQDLLPCLDSSAAHQVIKFLLPTPKHDRRYNITFEPVRADFNRQNGTNGINPLRHHVVFEEAQTWLGAVDDLESQRAKNVTGAAHAGWLLLSYYLPDVADEVAQDLSHYIQSSNIHWPDVLPAARLTMSYYDGKIISVPLESRKPYLFYRRDILLEKFNLTAPRTWEELIQVAAIVNGTDMDGDGKPDWALCGTMMGLDSNTSSCNGAMANFMTVMSTLTQGQGLQQGAFIDPETLEILINTVAGMETVEIFNRMRPYMHPKTYSTCSNLDAQFVSGQCAMAFPARIRTFKVTQMGENTKLRGKIGTAPIPGSTMILNRKTMQMELCTHESCPLAEQHVINGTTVLVNRVTKLDTGISMGVSSVAMSTQQRGAFRFIAHVSKSKEMTNMILSPNYSYGPIRYTQLEHQLWEKAGCDPHDAKEFIANTLWAFESAENVGTDLRVPGFGKIWNIVTERVTEFFMGTSSGSQMLRAVELLWEDQMQALGKENFRRMYYASINYGRVPPTKAPRRAAEMAGIITGCAVGGCLLLLSLAAFIYTRQHPSRSMFGRVLPPKAGPLCTLLVTDIQDSTLLWESMPMDTMDEVFKLHHACLRAPLKAFGGYESATEGDSFILAFHHPESALEYALQVQKDLLQVRWPETLLEAQPCRPLLVTRMGRDPTEGELRQLSTRNAAVWLTSQVKDNIPELTDTDSTLAGIELLAVRESAPAACDADNNFLRRCQTTWAVRHSDAVPDVRDSPHDQQRRTDDSRASEGDGDKLTLIFRGLRVRMGIHSGVEEGSITVGREDHRTSYAGPALTTAKVVADCGQGGTTSMSHSTYKHLPMEKLHMRALVMHNGLHALEDGKEPMHIYQCLDRDLKARLSVMTPVRSLKCLELGALDAPVGTITICFFKILGLGSAYQWNPSVAKQSEELCKQIAMDELLAQHGYPVEIKGEFLLAAFWSCRNAAVWATTTMQRCLEADWPQELLESDFGHEINMVVPQPDGSFTHQTLMRGLRCKAGMDVGPAMSTLHPITGKVGYRGRVVNRAARMAAKAKPQQIVCSKAVLESIVLAGDSLHLEAIGLGKMKLKGIAEELDLVQIKLGQPAQASCRTSILNLSFTGSVKSLPQLTTVSLVDNAASTPPALAPASTTPPASAPTRPPVPAPVSALATYTSTGTPAAVQYPRSAQLSNITAWNPAATWNPAMLNAAASHTKAWNSAALMRSDAGGSFALSAGDVVLSVRPQQQESGSA